MRLINTAIFDSCYSSEQERWGEVIVIFSGNIRIEVITQTRLTLQSVSFANLSTLGPVIVCRVSFYRPRVNNRAIRTRNYADTSSFLLV